MRRTPDPSPLEIAFVYIRAFAPVFALVFLIVGLVWFDTYIKASKCQDITTYGGPKTDYSLIQGCRVQTEQGLVPLENWRVTP